MSAKCGRRQSTGLIIEYRFPITSMDCIGYLTHEGELLLRTPMRAMDVRWLARIFSIAEVDWLALPGLETSNLEKHERRRYHIWTRYMSRTAPYLRSTNTNSGHLPQPPKSPLLYPSFSSQPAHRFPHVPETQSVKAPGLSTETKNVC